MSDRLRVTLEPVDVDRDLVLLHAWVTHPRSVFWMMQEASRDEVATEYARITDDPHHHAWLGRVDGTPAFLAETYDPARSELAALPELRPGDLGMHLLVAPGDVPVPGFTGTVMAAVLEHCFGDPHVLRVVVEPDVRNDRIATLNARAGFVVARVVALGHKDAGLSFCTREAFGSSTLAGRDPHVHPAHLTPDVLDRAQRHLVSKAISELSHERILEPRRLGDGSYEIVAPGGSSYTFTAERLALDHWAVEEASVRRHIDGEVAPLDVQAFVVELSDRLGIPDALLPVYLEELAATLAAAAWKLTHSSVPVAELVHADYQTIEAAMTEGHPGFVANNGRIGFGLHDYEAYAPEAGRPVRLVWLAARRTLTRLSLGEGLSEAGLYDAELGASTRAGFDEQLRSRGLDPADYLLVPVHPWQWRHKISVTFAPDLGRHDLVLLGEGPDDHRAQQSIRTFFNTSHPGRSYVKTALSVQNMGFMRGLSPAYMGPTPAINDYVHDLVASDGTLADCGFSVLRERAAIGYTGDAYHQLLDTHGVRSPYQKMVAALWRESPLPSVGPDERLATMASLLHRDAEGRSLAVAMVEASGVPAAEWVRTYLRAYVRPVVHCLLAHDLAFMPHGENLVLVLSGHVPVRVLMKDIGEEVAVMGDQVLPPDVERIRVEVDDDVKALALHTDVFDGVLRHLAAILHTDGVLDQDDFWLEVAACVQQHADDHPELAGAAAAYDLARAEFRHSCLNRLQLRNTLTMVDLTDQAESLIYAGVLVNPIGSTG